MRATLLMLCVCLAVPTRAAEDKTVQELTEKLIKAVGGEAKLKDAGACTLKVAGQIDVAELKIPVEGNWSIRGLDRFRWDARATVREKLQTGGILVHGEKAWIINDQNKENALPKEIAGALLINLRAIRMVQNPLLLRGKGVTLSSLGELKLDDRETVGLKISSKGFPDIDVFYDKKSGAPVKAEFRLKDQVDTQEVAHTLRFDESKEANGIKHFTKVKWLRDDKQHLQLDLSEIKMEETLDDSIFALPPK
jgi:hypothetical protein